MTPRFIAMSLACLALPTVALAQADADGSAQRTYKLQIGVGYPAIYSEEEPFINIARGISRRWQIQTKSGGKYEGQAAIEKGFVDPQTGMVQNPPADLRYASPGNVTVYADRHPEWAADKYTLRWKGDASGEVLFWERGGRPKRSSNEVRYDVNPAAAASSPLAFTRFEEDFGDVELFRTRHTERLERGEVWNPAYVNYLKRYDIIRTMDLQSVNGWPVRSFQDVARMDELWGQRFDTSTPPSPFYGVPYELLFDLGVVTGREIWLHMPPQIGAKENALAARFRKPGAPRSIDTQKLEASAAEGAKAALASPEWAVFADAFAERLIASGYPFDRPLYVEVANEIWNYGPTFSVSTRYATGVGAALFRKGGARHGVGALTARWAMALEAAFARHEINPNVIYVVASQAASPRRTAESLSAMRDYLARHDADLDAIMAKTGVSVSNYYGHWPDMEPHVVPGANKSNAVAKWEAAINEDPQILMTRLNDVILNGPENLLITKAWLLRKWAAHEEVADEYGVRFLGGYEGGSHLTPHRDLLKSEVFRSWWRDYQWGEAGAVVGREVNKALIARFPHAIISNYRAMGVIGKDPWIDGHYGEWTPMLSMWDEFARPEFTGPPSRD